MRLRNWVGDVTLSLPMLQRLHASGHALELIGKGWAADLLAGTGWTVHRLAGSAGQRIAQMRALAADARRVDPGFARRVQGLCLPDSFSSALEFRAAGLRSLGHAWEGRSLLLWKALPRPRGMHELEVYWRLGDALLGEPAPLPAAIELPLAPAHRDAARTLQAAHGLVGRSQGQPNYVVICPFAGGTWSGAEKTWPDFPRFAVDVLPRHGMRVVVCPGPGEEAVAAGHFAGTLCLEGVGLGTYAALLADAAAMVSNDTGPGHIAAAVGTPLVSVLGPSDASLWRAWGPRVQVVQGAGTWPSIAAVDAAVASALRG